MVDTLELRFLVRPCFIHALPLMNSATVSLYAWCFSLPLPLKLLCQFWIYLKRIRHPIYIYIPSPCHHMRCQWRKLNLLVSSIRSDIQFSSILSLAHACCCPRTCFVTCEFTFGEFVICIIPSPCHHMWCHEAFSFCTFLRSVLTSNSSIFGLLMPAAALETPLSAVSLPEPHLPPYIFAVAVSSHKVKNEYLFLRSVLTSNSVPFSALLTFFSTPRVSSWKKNWTSVTRKPQTFHPGLVRLNYLHLQ